MVLFFIFLHSYLLLYYFSVFCMDEYWNNFKVHSMQFYERFTKEIIPSEKEAIVFETNRITVMLWQCFYWIYNILPF